MTWAIFLARHWSTIARVAPALWRIIEAYRNGGGLEAVMNRVATELGIAATPESIDEFAQGSPEAFEQALERVAEDEQEISQEIEAGGSVVDQYGLMREELKSSKLAAIWRPIFALMLTALTAYIGVVSVPPMLSDGVTWAEVTLLLGLAAYVFAVVGVYVKSRTAEKKAAMVKGAA